MLILKREPGESWLKSLIRHAELHRASTKEVSLTYAEYHRDGYPESMAAWLAGHDHDILDYIEEKNGVRLITPLSTTLH